MKMFALATALLVSFSAYSQPVVIGDPSKGTPITTIKDGDANVTLTTTGISVEAPKKGEDGESGGVRVEGMWDEDIVVPTVFFLFLITVILGRRYFSSLDERRRLDLLRLMVEKGQQVPEAVVAQILSPADEPEAEDTAPSYKRTRNAFGFTVAGVSLMAYALIMRDLNNPATLVPGLVFLCLGIGGLAGIYLPKQSEKTVK